MDKKTKVTQKEVRGVLRDIFVDENGLFYSTVDGDKITGLTLELLVKRLIQATAPERKGLNIKFCRVDNRRGMNNDPVILHGTVTGKHATNNNMLVRIDGQTGSKQESMYLFGRRNDEGFLRLTETQEAELLAALRQEAEAHRKVENLIKRYGFDVRQEVNKLLWKLGVQDE